MQVKERTFKYSYVIAVIALLGLVAACNGYNSTSQKSKVRVVNSEGKVVNLERRVPRLNVENLEQQKAENIKFLGTEEIEAAKKEGEVSTKKVSTSTKKAPEEIAKAEIDNAPVATEAVAATATATATAASQAEESDGVRYVFKTSEEERARKEEIAKTAKSSSGSKPMKDGYYVQLGAYKFEKNANRMLNDYKAVSTGMVKETTTTNDNTIYKVLLGPVNSRAEAQKVMNKVIQKGHYDAFIVGGKK